MEKAVDLEELRRLIAIVEGNQIEELVVEEEGLEIVIKVEKREPTPASPPSPAEGATSPASSVPALPAPRDFSPEALPEDKLWPIVAPLVGVFYRSPAPEEPPFVEEGDWVEVGQIVGTIEAMKIFNDLHAEVSGRVVRVLAENEQLVMQGETLLLLERGDSEGGKHG